MFKSREEVRRIVLQCLRLRRECVRECCSACPVTGREEVRKVALSGLLAEWRDCIR